MVYISSNLLVEQDIAISSAWLQSLVVRLWLQSNREVSVVEQARLSNQIGTSDEADRYLFIGDNSDIMGVNNYSF